MITPPPTCPYCTERAATVTVGVLLACPTCAPVLRQVAIDKRDAMLRQLRSDVEAKRMERAA